MKAILSCFFLGFCSLYIHAQPHRITGRLVDEKEKPVGYAGIYLFKSPDSLKVTTAMTDSLGYFQLNGVPKGSYKVKINYVGYLSYTSDVLDLGGRHQVLSLGSIRLLEDNRLLHTVEIAASRPLLEQRLDRMVMNVENSVLSQGSTALELLSKAPGVTIDDSGEISLKGRPGTTVMINGKLTYLSGSQLANLLRGTASNTVSRIEIMANPSARYDAAGKGGIINILLKKNVKTGLNGNVSVNGGAGRGARLGGGTDLNYRTEKINVFGNYNYFFQNLKGNTNTDRTFFTDQPATQVPSRISRQETVETAKLRSQNFRAGLDVFLNEKNTLGFLINGGVGKYPSLQKTKNILYNGAGNEQLWDTRTLTEGKERWEDMLYNVNYLRRFDDKGHELTLDMDYVSHFSKMDQQLDTRYMDPSGTILRVPGSRRGDLPSNNDIYVAKLDYTLPLGGSGKLESGWKGSYVQTENNLKYDTLKNEIYLPDAGTSNHFKYKEQIQAGYVNLKYAFGKFSFQVGLRGEYTFTRGHQITTDSLVTREYFKVFPSVFLNQELNENHKLQIGYSKRIERPSYWDLNPFRIYVDPFSYEEGNPYLQPAIVNSFELGYSFKSKYHANLTYSRSNDVISNIVGGFGAQNMTFMKPENLATFVNYGLSITGSTDFTAWWTSTQFANLFRNEFTVNDKGLRTALKGNSFTFDSQNSFKIGQGWKAELNGLHRSKALSGVFSTKGYYVVSVGAKKELIQGKASLNLMVNDIFKSARYRHSANYGGIKTYSYERPDSRSVILSFSYRFGSGPSAEKARNTGSQELKDRIK
jgi:hypothetical protein